MNIQVPNDSTEFREGYIRTKAQEMFYQTEGDLPTARENAKHISELYQEQEDFLNAGFWGLVYNFLSLENLPKIVHGAAKSSTIRFNA